ncbi:MAG: hypothetical protein JST79_19075 [Acidobacteria bacterium]|nr:hypothetical protein [Acidobacteriota bacterium]
MSQNDPLLPPSLLPPKPGSAAPASEPPASPLPFDIGEEFGTAKKNLPPVKIVGIGVALILLIVGVWLVLQPHRSPASGSIQEVAAVEVPDQHMVLVAINVAFHNGGKKPFWIHNMEAEIESAGKQFKDDAASASDFDRYFQAFPALKAHALPGLKMEDKILPEADAQGTVIVSFPVTMDEFNARKSLKVRIYAYDQAVPLELVK